LWIASNSQECQVAEVSSLLIVALKKKEKTKSEKNLQHPGRERHGRHKITTNDILFFPSTTMH
jgi:hypothetical protein